MRPKPGGGWKHLGGVVYENPTIGVRIHGGGLIRIHTPHGVTWANMWPTTQRWDRHTAMAGGNRKRGLMTLAIEIAKGSAK